MSSIITFTYYSKWNHANGTTLEEIKTHRSPFWSTEKHGFMKNNSVLIELVLHAMGLGKINSVLIELVSHDSVLIELVSHLFLQVSRLFLQISSHVILI